MEMDWQEDYPPFKMTEDFDLRDTTATIGIPYERLDTLLPPNPETGAVAFAAFRVYLDTMITLMGRHGQPLSLLCLGVDDNTTLRFLGAEGASLIGRAVARCLHQETRVYDVVGCAPEKAKNGLPNFLIVCPFADEEKAANLAQRLSLAMAAHASEPDRPWLTFSIGVASLSMDITTAGEFISRAEQALNRAGRKGNGSVWRHTDTLRRLIERENTEREDEEPPTIAS